MFAPALFLDLGTRQAVDVALHRLTKEGRIRRIRQGLYDQPRAHPILGQTAPDPMAVVRALMAGSHAQWQPSGAYAANLLGLSDQVPAKIVIQTDGVPRQVKLGNLTLAFRRAAPRNLLGAGRTSGLVIQAIRHIGADGITPEIKRRLRAQLDPTAKKDLGKFALKAPAWMRPIVEEIAAG
ncbi:MAG: DUF6088 family protein [Opitutaceae bacterium]